MSLRLVVGERAVWAALGREARASRRADVAVAYFGQGGARRLPLPAGSRLAVDASEPTVRAGATCPEELLKLVRKGVDVYSRPNLHAKVYVFGRTALVGSANVSTASADRLVEAVIRTTDSAAVHDARGFIVEMCEGAPLGPEALRKLQKLYRPPHVRSAVVRKHGQRPRVWLDVIPAGDYPEGSGGFARQVLREARAKTRRRRGYHLLETWWTGAPVYREDDIVIMLDERDMMDPPGRVIHLRSWKGSGGAHTFAVLELPTRRRVAVTRLAAALGRGWKKRLSRRGRLSAETARTLQAWWSERT